ncbi:MAG: enoyl-CoA hydratase [Hyphomicrobiaceae bacterium TMED74]|nr:enoyl-CoA hydratase [Filomicrobium sp.]RPG39515.1 MAG: enoyl-CoA hydratase [Hyphomicrobiaceae bacterium TMED74]
MSDSVIYTCDNHIAVITMNKADRMNRLDPEIVDGLNQCWKRFMADDDARVAVLTGSGEKAFSAGADLKNVPHDLYRAIPSIGVPVDKPVIGAVAGWCIGGGMVLTTMCDIIICADNTTFSYPEVKIAFSGGLISNLASRIPHKLAMELLLVGDNMSVQRAYEVGYVNKIVPVAELMPTAMEWAGKIADTAPMPSRMLKRFVLDTMPKGPTEQAAIARVQVEAINDSSDWVEGQAAFAEKRKPNYHGR